MYTCSMEGGREQGIGKREREVGIVRTVIVVIIFSSPLPK